MELPLGLAGASTFVSSKNYTQFGEKRNTSFSNMHCGWTISAKTEEGDRIEGFESGADDYVCKPFSPKELMLRVLVILKRAGDGDDDKTVLQVNGINLDIEHHSVRVHDKAVELTATEFRLLRLLMQELGKVQTRETLLEKVWNYENDMETRTVDTHMRRLREKLGEEGSGLETVRGVGYRMVESRS